MRPKVMLVALVALTLCNALGRRVTPKSGVGRRSGSKPPARVWDSGDGWDHKAVDVEERERTGGRSRAAKRSAVYDGLRAYDGHWQRLLLAEWRAEQSALREQIERWPPGRLAKEGWLLMDLEVMRLPDDFFGEPVVKLTLPPARRGERGAAATPALSSAGRPPLPFHRFAPGDVVTLCPGDEPKLPAWLEEEEEEEEGGEGALAREADRQRGGSTSTSGAIDGVVLQRTATALQLVVRQLPAVLESGSAAGGNGGGRQRQRMAYPYCLCRGASAVPFERCRAAVAEMADPTTATGGGDGLDAAVCAELRSLISGSFFDGGAGPADDFVTRARLPPAFLGKRAEVRPAVKAALESYAETAKRGSGRSPPALNPSQLETIRTALGRRCTLIQGPAGTGKTKTACALLAATVHLHRARLDAKRSDVATTSRGGRRAGGRRGGAPSSPPASALGVLAVAASNVAADELVEGLGALGVRVLRVGQPASIRPELRRVTLDAEIERSPAVKTAREKLKGAQDSGSLGSAVSLAFQEVRRAERAAALRALGKADVVVSSCVGAGKLSELAEGPNVTPDQERATAGAGAVTRGRARGGRGGGGRGRGLVGRGRGRGGRNGERGGAFDGAMQGAGAAPRGAMPPLERLRFSTVLVDEATQATEPASLVPLLLGCAQLYLVGDTKQLPPTVADLEASRDGLAASLFERLQDAGLSPLLLDTQYRMHPSLAEFSSRRFYDGRLKSAVSPADRPLPKGLRWPNPQCPLAFVSVQGPEQRAAAEAGGVDATAVGGTSLSNPSEAAAVAQILSAVLASGDLRPEQVGVITPYSAQALLLRTKIAEERRASAKMAGADGRRADQSSGVEEEVEEVEVEVSSVDGFQGREKELIIFSAVRSNEARAVGFLADERRLNVAITRARRGLVIVGDGGTLGAGSETWREYLRFLTRKGCMLPETRAILQAKGEAQ